MSGCISSGSLKYFFKSKTPSEQLTSVILTPNNPINVLFSNFPVNSSAVPAKDNLLTLDCLNVLRLIDLSDLGKVI